MIVRLIKVGDVFVREKIYVGFIIESSMQTACIQKLAHVGVPWYFLGNPISINSRKDCLTCLRVLLPDNKLFLDASVPQMHGLKPPKMLL